MSFLPATLPPLPSPPAVTSHYELRSGDSVDFLLYSQVTNIDELIQLYNSKQLQAAPVNPALICQLFPLLCAANKTCYQQRRNQLKTKDVYSEMLFNLSPSNHILTALEKLVCPSGSDRVLLVSFNRTAEQLIELKQRVKGIPTDLTSLRSSCDSTAIIKMFKISEIELQLPCPLDDPLTTAVLSRLATK